MTRAWVTPLAAFACAVAVSGSAAAFSERLDPRIAVARSNQAVGRALGDYTLVDSRGASFALADYRGKPLVISLVYTSCSSVCPPTTQHLIEAVTEARRVMGTDSFEVLTFGFDAKHDAPAQLAQFAIAQGIRQQNWRLASADPATIDALLADVGFSYRSVAGGFDHVTQTTIVDRNGKVFRQVYGDDFPLPVFVEPLREAVQGTRASLARFADIVERIRFICTVYDAGAGRYRVDFGLVFGGTVAALSLLIMAGLIAREWTRTRNVSSTS